MGIITVSRTHGSGGTEFARALAKRLDYTFATRTVINNNHDLGKIHAAIFGFGDEEPVSFLDQLQELMSNRNFYKVSLVASIYEYAIRDNVVFTGMGAAIVLAGIGNLLNIRIVRLLAERVKAIAQLKNIPYDDAFDLVEEMDQGKKKFISHYFDTDITDPTLYSLTLNSSLVSLTDGIEIAAGYAKRLFSVGPKPETEQLLKKKLLEKRAEMLLFRLGMAHSYGKVQFEATDEGLLILRGTVIKKDERDRLIDGLGRNKAIRQIDDQLEIGPS